MEYEFYFPKTKSKHMATPVKGKVYPSKGGTVRYGIQATMNGSMSLPKYIKEEEFNRLGFGAEEKKNCGCGKDPCITYGAEIGYDGAKSYAKAIDSQIKLVNSLGFFPADEEDFKDMVVEEIEEHIDFEDWKEEYGAEIEGNVEYERIEERTVDIRQEIEQPFSVQTDPAEYEHEYPEDIENAIKHGIHKQLYDNPDSKLAREGGFIENIETDVEVVDLEDDPDSEPRELTAYGNLGKPEVNDEEEYYRQAKITDIEKEFRATSGSGMINHDAIDKVIERPAIMRYNHAFTDYDWDSDEDLDEFEENLLKEEIVDAVGRSPNKGSKNLFIDIDNKDVYVSTNTNHGEGRFYGFDAETFEARGTYNLYKSQEKVLKAYRDNGGDEYNCMELPDTVWDKLLSIRDSETLCSDVERWLRDNPAKHSFNAESKMDNCPVCKGDIHADMSMIGEETVADICGECDIYIMPQENDYPRVSCIECGFGDPYGSATTCMNCDAIKNEMEFINMEAEAVIVAGLDGRYQAHKIGKEENDGFTPVSIVPVDEDNSDIRMPSSVFENHADTVGNPSPSSPLEETPATVPSPAEPTNESFESQNTKMKLTLGLAGIGIGLAFWKGKEVMSLWDSITSRLKK